MRALVSCTVQSVGNKVLHVCCDLCTLQKAAWQANGGGGGVRAACARTLRKLTCACSVGFAAITEEHAAPSCQHTVKTGKKKKTLAKR